MQVLLLIPYMQGGVCHGDHLARLSLGVMRCILSSIIKTPQDKVYGRCMARYSIPASRTVPCHVYLHTSGHHRCLDALMA